MNWLKQLLFGGILATLVVVRKCDYISCLLAAFSILPVICYYLGRWVLFHFYGDYILQDKPIDSINISAATIHDVRRFRTYPDPYPNAWFHILDSTELKKGELKEFRACGQVFILWRNKEGKPICQDAFCLHLGANLAQGKIVDDCVECPFHRWKFSDDGSIADIPYLKDKSQCGSQKKLKTYPCVDWCGLVCVYFHADDKEPEYELPKYIETQLQSEKWAPHLKWDIGYTPLTVVDWVDQAGDHSHFNTLHADFLIPWTTIPIPTWISKLIPLGIYHELITYRGDDEEWKHKVERQGYGVTDKHFIYFTDKAGLTWKKKIMETTVSETLEVYIGPGIVCFNIPFTVGTFKVLLSFTPVDAGCIMRVRTWIDQRTQNSFFVKTIAWILAGISASQLASDKVLIENKIRLKKPLLQPFDGPYNRINAWMKQFYSESSSKIGYSYKNDW